VCFVLCHFMPSRNVGLILICFALYLCILILIRYKRERLKILSWVRNQCGHLLHWKLFLYKFNAYVTIHCVKFLTIKPTRCTNFSNLFLEWNSTCFGQFLCPKHVEFHSKNKFEKLVHLVFLLYENLSWCMSHEH
jgi:hypothetical protein